MGYGGCRLFYRFCVVERVPGLASPGNQDPEAECYREVSRHVGEGGQVEWSVQSTDVSVTRL